MSPADRAAAATRRAARKLRAAAGENFCPGLDPAFRPYAPAHLAGMAVVTCHYNFADYDTPARNLLRFLREMDSAGLPVYGMEIHRDGAAPLMQGSPRWVCQSVDDRAHLWQKEAALNAVVAALPAEVTAVALVDADVRFERGDWAAASLRALAAGAPAVQPFTEAVWTDARGRPELRRIAAAARRIDRHWHSHPGFAWVIAREFWTRGPGLYPWCLTGAGDVALALGLGCADPVDLAQIYELATGEKNAALAGDWLGEARLWLDGRECSAVPGRVWHEWHGSRADRRYLERHAVNARVDIERHVRLDERGLLRWARRAPKGAIEAVASYFHQRREDG